MAGGENRKKARGRFTLYGAGGRGRCSGDLLRRAPVTKRVTVVRNIVDRARRTLVRQDNIRKCARARARV